MLQLVELLFEGLHLDIQHLGLAGLELVGLSLPGRGLERGEMQMRDLPADLDLLRLAEPCAVTRREAGRRPCASRCPQAVAMRRVGVESRR